MKWESVDISSVPEVVGGPLLALLVVAAYFLWQFRFRWKRRRWTRRPRTWRDTSKGSRTPTVVPNSPPNLADPKVQMGAIARVPFEKQRLLNKTEYRVLLVLERVVAEVGGGHRIMAQTSLGELIKPKQSYGTDEARKQAFASINSKRLDFAIIDRFGMLACAIEVQGSGHYQQEAFMRDAVKREALRRAGVDLIEVQESWSPKDIADRVRRGLETSMNIHSTDTNTKQTHYSPFR